MPIHYGTNDVTTSGIITAVSGNFTESLLVNGTGVSLNTHTHGYISSSGTITTTIDGNSASIDSYFLGTDPSDGDKIVGYRSTFARILFDDINNSVVMTIEDGYITWENIYVDWATVFRESIGASPTGHQHIYYSDIVGAIVEDYGSFANDIKFAVGPATTTDLGLIQVDGTSVTISGGIISVATGYAPTSHTHTASDITNFNSSVSGLLPKIANSGDNRILSSTGSSVGINAESNLTFNGSLLSIIGDLSASGPVSGQYLISSNSTTNEGGQIRLAKPSSGASFSGTAINLDIYNNQLRIFEAGSPNRGYYLDITEGSGGAATPLLNKSLAFFTASNNQPPTSNFATLDTRNSIMVLDFDAATSETGVFLGVIPYHANLTNGLNVRINWAASTATSGNCVWGVQFEDMNTDMDADSFATAATGVTTTNATAGIPSITSISTTNIDNLGAGDFFRLRVYRDAASASDTMAGDAELISLEVRSI